MKWVLEDLKLATVNSGASFWCFFPPLAETKPTVLRPPMMREVTTDIPMSTSASIFSYSTCISFYQLLRSLHTVDSVAYAWTVHKFLLLLHCILISPAAGPPKSPLATVYKLRPSTYLDITSHDFSDQSDRKALITPRHYTTNLLLHDDTLPKPRVHCKKLLKLALEMNLEMPVALHHGLNGNSEPGRQVPPAAFFNDADYGESSKWISPFCLCSDWQTCFLSYLCPFYLCGKTHWRLKRAKQGEDALDSSWKCWYGCNAVCLGCCILSLISAVPGGMLSSSLLYIHSTSTNVDGC